MTAFEIPIHPPQAQRFTITLAGNDYRVAFKWNDISQTWIFDLSNSLGDMILAGQPLITGADLLAQYEYLNIGGQMFVQTDHDPNAVPTFTNIGDTSHWYFVVP